MTEIVFKDPNEDIYHNPKKKIVNLMEKIKNIKPLKYDIKKEVYEYLQNIKHHVFQIYKMVSFIGNHYSMDKDYHEIFLYKIPIIIINDLNNLNEVNDKTIMKCFEKYSNINSDDIECYYFDEWINKFTLLKYIQEPKNIKELSKLMIDILDDYKNELKNDTQLQYFNNIKDSFTNLLNSFNIKINTNINKTIDDDNSDIIEIKDSNIVNGLDLSNMERLSDLGFCGVKHQYVQKIKNKLIEIAQMTGTMFGPLEICENDNVLDRFSEYVAIELKYNKMIDKKTQLQYKKKLEQREKELKLYFMKHIRLVHSIEDAKFKIQHIL